MAIRPNINRNLAVARSLQRWRPASGIEESQGDPYYNQPGVTEQLQFPADPGIEYRGWLNPFKSSTYVAVVQDTAVITALPGNMRRTYLLLQNLGPGNIWMNFGSDAGVNACHFLITGQFYEQIGGGAYNYDTRRSVPNAFVTRDYVSLLADQPDTVVVITEGLWNYVQEEIAGAR